jgi:hypothetical protein
VLIGRLARNVPPKYTAGQESPEAAWFSLDKLDGLPLRTPEVHQILWHFQDGGPVYRQLSTATSTLSATDVPLPPTTYGTDDLPQEKKYAEKDRAGEVFCGDVSLVRDSLLMREDLLGRIPTGALDAALMSLSEPALWTELDPSPALETSTLGRGESARRDYAAEAADLVLADYDS